jgi:SagB-type dehydrogenase family enzyme
MTRGVKVLNRTTKIKFIAPHQTGRVSVEQCISQRRSVRGFRSQTLTEEKLGQLLWAAQGVTTADGKRAVSSAGALYPLQLYTACSKVSGMTGGVYRYDPGHHELLLVSPGRQCEKLFDAARGQEWIANAPAVICIAADFERTTSKYGARGRGYVYIEAGQAAESLMLQAVALKLASTIVGAFGDEEVKHLLHLALNETPLCLLPVGEPRDCKEIQSEGSQSIT